MIATLASCQKSEELSSDADGSSWVTFTSGISTRATGTSWDVDDQIGVFMYISDEADTYNNDSENVLYTTTLGGSSATFTSSNPLVFPKEIESTDYIAYYPHTTNYSTKIITLNTADQSSEARVKAQDFMVARAPLCKKEDTPSLSFSRKMSKIIIDIDRKDSKAEAVLSEIMLTDVIVDGTFTIDNSNIENASVVAGSTTSNISLFENSSNQIEAIITPQTLSQSMLILLIDGERFSATISNSLNEDTQYTYNLSIGVDQVLFTQGSITDWTEEESGDMSTLPLD